MASSLSISAVISLPRKERHVTGFGRTPPPGKGASARRGHSSRAPEESSRAYPHVAGKRLVKISTNPIRDALLPHDRQMGRGKAQPPSSSPFEPEGIGTGTDKGNALLYLLGQSRDYGFPGRGSPRTALSPGGMISDTCCGVPDDESMSVIILICDLLERPSFRARRTPHS